MPGMQGGGAEEQERSRRANVCSMEAGVASYSLPGGARRVSGAVARTVGAAVNLFRRSG